MGRTAFKEERWDDAIEYFTKVLELDPVDVACLAIRSSAYQKKGDLESALKDANESVTIQPTYVRGYIRKACILRAQKDYSTEVETYVQGLEHCPGEESLTKGLQMARRLKTSSSKASQAAKTTQATRNAAISRSLKANNAKDIASFVSQTKMNLELQMVALQAQLDLVREITSMNQSEKIQLLFSLITTNGKMTNLHQVAEAVQQASLLLPFGESLQTALASAETSDNPMDLASFSNFVQGMVKSLDISVGDFAEFVVYQVLFTGVASQVAAATEATSDPTPQKSILNDERMQSLFVLFDKDADATVDFKEVALGLYPLTKNMGDAAKNAAGLLLMVDKDDQRELTYEQFVKLMLAVSGAFGMTFDELADQLTLALANAAEDDVDESFLQEIMVAEEAYTKAAEQRKEEDE